MAISKTIRQMYLDGHLVTPEKAALVPNGLEPDWFGPALHILRPEQEIRFLFVGRLAREKGLHPNADLPVGLLVHLMGIPVELSTPVFLCARIAGIAAHVLEQRADNRLVRPRAAYEGPADRSSPPGFTPSRC